MRFGFTGHRPNKLFPSNPYSVENFDYLVEFARRVVRWAKAQGMDTAVVGMALGWDQAVAVACIWEKVPFIAAVPFPGQESVWPEESQAAYRMILEQAKEIHYVIPDLKQSGVSAAYALQLRNVWMIENSGKMVALWDGTQGGTRNCIREARKGYVNVWSSWVEFQKRNPR